jgi:hypothetical protein
LRQSLHLIALAYGKPHGVSIEDLDKGANDIARELYRRGQFAWAISEIAKGI